MGWTRLYAAGPGTAPTLVREILPAATHLGDLTAGLYGTRASGEQALFLLWPSVGVKFVTVLTSSAPQRAETIAYKSPLPQDDILIPMVLVAASDPALGPVLVNATPQGGPDHTQWALLEMLALPQRDGAKTRAGAWRDYLALRSSGVADAPCADTNLWLSAEVYGDHIALPNVLSLSGRDEVELAPAPPSLPAVDRGTPKRLGKVARILGANQRFLLYSLVPPIRKDAYNRDIGVPGPALVYVYDRAKERLTTLTLPTPRDYPACRLFGNWVATPVTVAAPDNTYHPGSENERGWGSLKHPEVRKIYEDYANYFYLPGELQLNNLADGRQVSIRTGQEDSEVLDVSRDGWVLYRVNDKIFSARVEGKEIGPPTLVVKGDDIPEVHWVLWSPVAPGTGEPQEAR